MSRTAAALGAGWCALLLAVLAAEAGAQPPGPAPAPAPGAPGAAADAGVPEAGAGRRDADAGTSAGSVEAGSVDGGTPGIDGGGLDAGAFDAGAFDAGELDAGGLDAAVGREESGPAGGDTGSVPAASSANPEAAPEPPAAEPTPSEVLRTLLGLLGLLALAWLVGQPGVRRLEERLGVTHIAASGLPFALLGLLLHAPGVDVLSDRVLGSITPLLQFGLGWIGFHTGFQFEARSMEQVPRGTGSVVLLLTSFPFVLVTAAAGALLWGSGLVEHEALATGSGWQTLARDACLIGLAGALSAPVVSARVEPRGEGRPGLAATIAVLDDVFGVLALVILSAWLRPTHDHDWQLPGVGWLFVTLGMAATLGLVVHFALLTAESTGERISLLLGSVAFTAGLAGYASISPLVVCFLAGLVLRNFPGGDKAAFEAAFTRLERPIYLVFLTIAGALWHIGAPLGWMLLVAFVAARLAGRALGAQLARRLPASARPESLATTPDRELVLAPMGQLAIALVVAAQTLYESQAIQAIVTAVIGGSIVAEVLVRFALPRPGPEAPKAPEEDGYVVIERREAELRARPDQDPPASAGQEEP